MTAGRLARTMGAAHEVARGHHRGAANLRRGGRGSRHVGHVARLRHRRRPARRVRPGPRLPHPRAHERQNPPLPDDAPTRRPPGGSRGSSRALREPALLGLRPEGARPGPLQLPAGQSRRDPGLLPPFHPAGRHRHPQDLPPRRGRVLQHERRQPVAPRDRRARARRHRRDEPGPAVRVRGSDRRARERSGLRDRRRRPAGSRAGESRAVRDRCRGRQADCRRDRGRGLPADRHRRDAQRRLLDPARMRRARPRRAHRDDDRRPRRTVQSRAPDGDAENAGRGQERLHVRARLAAPLFGARPEPGHALLPGRLHEQCPT